MGYRLHYDSSDIRDLLRARCACAPRTEYRLAAACIVVCRYSRNRLDPMARAFFSFQQSSLHRRRLFQKRNLNKRKLPLRHRLNRPRMLQHMALQSGLSSWALYWLCSEPISHCTTRQTQTKAILWAASVTSFHV